MKFPSLIKAGLTASLFLVLSLPAQACEYSNKQDGFADTDSLSQSTMAYIKSEFSEE